MRIVAPIQKIQLVRQNSSKKNFFFAWQFYTLYKQNFSNLRPLLSITFPEGFQKSKAFRHWTLRNRGKRTFKRSEQVKKSEKNFFCCGAFTPFMSKSFQIWDHFFPLLFPKDSENLKSLDIWLREVGAKRPLNGVRNTVTEKILLSKAKFAQKLIFFCAQGLKTLYYWKFSSLTPLLFITFPQQFWISNKFWHTDGQIDL